MQVLLKFFKNTKHPDLRVLSRTLLKVAVISKHVYEAKQFIPNEGDFWLCRIIKETKPGEVGGCFVVEPIEKIEPVNTVKLFPGSYTYEILKGRMLIKPKRVGNWLLPLEHKRMLAEKYNAYCVIVDLEQPEVDIPEPEQIAS